MFLGIDVGTGSARAGIFDATGVRLGMGVSAFPTWKPQDDFVQQSSDAIWREVVPGLAALHRQDTPCALL